jgi:hypothetical protein
MLRSQPLEDASLPRRKQMTQAKIPRAYVCAREQSKHCLWCVCGGPVALLIFSFGSARCRNGTIRKGVLFPRGLALLPAVAAIPAVQVVGVALFQIRLANIFPNTTISPANLCRRGFA